MDLQRMFHCISVRGTVGDGTSPLRTYIEADGPTALIIPLMAAV